MLNSDPAPIDGTDADGTGTDGTRTDGPGSTQDAAVDAAMRTGAPGAIALAGIASAVVVALWFAFYLFVFVPRAGAP
jgi:hypothetical protein